MSEKMIQIGDTVSVFFTSSQPLMCVKVIYKPGIQGDSWHFNTGLPNGIVYVTLFERMDLIRKGE